MAAPDWSVASPSPTAGAVMDTTLASQAIDKAHIGSETDRQNAYLGTSFSQYQMPQLQSGIAANGQASSTANTKAQQQAYLNFSHQAGDINTAAQRQLDDLTRQRMFAALGLVI